MSTRRNFIRLIPLAGGAVLTGRALAQPMVDEKDPTALSLGYVSDVSKVDKAKYPKYAAGQGCHACALYQGKAGAASGPCPIFAGKQVSVKGWCSAFAKKP